VYLMVLVLNKTENLDGILENLYEAGVSGATVIDSRGMGRVICDNVPLFGGLQRLFNDCRPENKTVFSVIKSEEMINEAVEAIESVIGDLEAAGQGIIFTIPLHMVKGFVPKQENPPDKKI